MSTSASSAPSVEVGEAFGFVFRSPRWFGRLALGALCLLFFWVFLIPVFILLGYFVETARVVSRGGRELPPWSDVGKKLKEGFVLAVVLFIWGLPGSILSLSGFSGFHCDAAGCTSPSSSLYPLGALYSLLIGLLTPAIWAQYLEGGFSAAFDFRAVFRRAGMSPGLTVMVWLMAIVAEIIGGLGAILILVGLLFTLPYAFAVIANLYGQYARLTEPALAASSPGQPA
jgi:uncharacterized protein DUF4013